MPPLSLTQLKYACAMLAPSVKSVPGCLVTIAPTLIGVPVAFVPGFFPHFVTSAAAFAVVELPPPPPLLDVRLVVVAAAARGNEHRQAGYEREQRKRMSPPPVRAKDRPHV